MRDKVDSLYIYIGEATLKNKQIHQICAASFVFQISISFLRINYIQ